VETTLYATVVSVPTVVISVLIITLPLTRLISISEATIPERMDASFVEYAVSSKAESIFPATVTANLTEHL